MTNLQEIEARAEAAHPGPWKHYSGMIQGPNEKIGGEMRVADVRGWGYFTGRGHGGLALSDEEAIARQEAIGEFIAHARQDIPLLLSELRKLDEMLTDTCAERDAIKAEVEQLYSELRKAREALEEGVDFLTSFFGPVEDEGDRRRWSDDDAFTVWRKMQAALDTLSSTTARSTSVTLSQQPPAGGGL